ncbi:MAG: hypothetical protein P1U34_07090 [Coxiellaceae bacterium]|nr:hypothetical protein [Coxiellaceae bacterium]
MTREYQYNSEEMMALQYSLEKQMQNWNAFYTAKQPNLATAQVTSDVREVKCLSVPKVEGREPTPEELKACVNDMLNFGYCMLDYRNTSNFRVSDNGVVYPVRFSRVAVKPAGSSSPSAKAQYSSFEGVVREGVRTITASGSPKSTHSSDSSLAGNKEENTEFLQQLCAKAQTKVHNRYWSLGMAGKRVQVGDKSYVVPGHLAQAITANLNKVSPLTPATFKHQLLQHLKQSSGTKVKSTTSRDVWTQRLYNGDVTQGSNAVTFFNTMIDDQGPKKSCAAEVDNEQRRALIS